jgi:hypothetical protein
MIMITIRVEIGGNDKIFVSDCELKGSGYFFRLYTIYKKEQVLEIVHY